MAERTVVLCILDGWGWSEQEDANAVRLGQTPNFDRLWAEQPRCFLRTSGEDVGLPVGQIGNSEVGHMNLGAGRVVMQDLPRIDRAIEDGALANIEALKNAIGALQASGGTAHLMGLLSPGGVHAHQRHIAALAKAFDEAGVPVRVHAFTDGRDVPPKSAADDLKRFGDDIAACGNVRVATVSGRYFAMDRDRRWQRVERAYRAIVNAEGTGAPTAVEAVSAAYARGETDEFVTPSVIEGYRGFKDGDGVVFANFRADRARQILAALLEPNFDDFARDRAADGDGAPSMRARILAPFLRPFGVHNADTDTAAAAPAARNGPPKTACALGMVNYSEQLDRFMTVLFPPQELHDLLGTILAAHGIKQLRTAETEKYPHVTFFFNGGEENPAQGETRTMIPSPKVATYDLQPEMSADAVADVVVEALKRGEERFILVNFANPDMVGHTGDLAAAIKAVETVDACLGRVLSAVDETEACMIVTADHGNCETMVDANNGGPHTAHTLNPVPCVLLGVPGAALRDGRLADVAPTVLQLFDLEQPAAMTGHSLLDAPAATAPAPEPENAATVHDAPAQPHEAHQGEPS